MCAQINASRADLVWVCLGCPRQERWIAQHRDKLNAPVLLAVGAAFDFAAGKTNRAPKFMREHGLEWLHRLLKDPRRLARRYLVYNAFFLYLLLTRGHSQPALVQSEEKVGETELRAA